MSGGNSVHADFKADYVIVGSGSSGSAMASRLSEDGKHSVIVIEHNLHVIRRSDWVIEVGPDSGAGGGSLIAACSPDSLLRNPDSVTGQFLARNSA